jgi:hypothetical protein
VNLTKLEVHFPKYNFVDLIYAKLLKYKLVFLLYCMIFDLDLPTESRVLL